MAQSFLLVTVEGVDVVQKMVYRPLEATQAPDGIQPLLREGAKGRCDHADKRLGPAVCEDLLHRLGVKHGPHEEYLVGEAEGWVYPME